MIILNGEWIHMKMNEKTEEYYSFDDIKDGRNL